MDIKNTPEFRASQIQVKADLAEVVDLDDARRERWVRILEEKKALGQAAIFGVIGEVDAVILPFRLQHVISE